MNRLNVFRYGMACRWYRKPIQFFKNIKYAFQRAKYGFCEYDAFELFSFYRILISQSLKYLAENTHGYPVELSEDGWYSILYRMADYIENSDPDELDAPIADDYFKRYIENKDSKETLEELRKMMLAEALANSRIAESNLRHGLELLEKYWLNLWD